MPTARPASCTSAATAPTPSPAAAATTSSPAEAVAIYEASIKVLPKQTDAYVGIALVQLLAGKPELADAAFARLVAANPDSFRAFLRRAEYRRARGQYKEALQDCD